MLRPHGHGGRLGMGGPSAHGLGGAWPGGPPNLVLLARGQQLIQHPGRPQLTGGRAPRGWASGLAVEARVGPQRQLALRPLGQLFAPTNRPPRFLNFLFISKHVHWMGS
jgi:hypothetical protein